MKVSQKVWYIKPTPSGHRIIAEAKYLGPNDCGTGGLQGQTVCLETIPHQLYPPNVKPPADYKPDDPERISVAEQGKGFWISYEAARGALLHIICDDIEKLVNDFRRYAQG